MPDTLLTSLAERLLSLRQAAGLSQEALTDRAGIDRTWYAKVERGRGNPTVTALARIAAGHDMTLSSLLEGVRGAERPADGEG